MTNMQAIQQIQPTADFISTEPMLPGYRYGTEQSKKWTYLIANRIKFNQAFEHCIQLNKPDANTLYLWLAKIVSAGQCDLILVENLDLEDRRIGRLKRFCEKHGVTLVNLTIGHEQLDNLVVGPWQ